MCAPGNRGCFGQAARTFWAGGPKLRSHRARRRRSPPRCTRHRADRTPPFKDQRSLGCCNPQCDLVVNATADGVNLDSIGEVLTAALAQFYAERTATRNFCRCRPRRSRSPSPRRSGRNASAWRPSFGLPTSARQRRPDCRDGDTGLRKMPTSGPAAVDGNIACRQRWWCPPASWHWARSSDCCRVSLPDIHPIARGQPRWCDTPSATYLSSAH